MANLIPIYLIGLILIHFSFTFYRRKRFKLGGSDKDTLEEELSALSNLNRFMASSQPAPPPPPPMPAVLPPMLPPRPFAPHMGVHPPTSGVGGPPFLNPGGPFIPPIDIFALRSSAAAHAAAHERAQHPPPPPTTPPSATITSPPSPPLNAPNHQESSKPKKKSGFSIDSLMESKTAKEESSPEEPPVKPSPLFPPISRAWPPFYPQMGDLPREHPHPGGVPAGYPPLLPNFHLQAAANLHMAAMAALAAQQHHQNQQNNSSSEVPLNFLRNSSPGSPPGSEVPFLEVPREEAVVSSLSHQQLSPTARSDISSCSSRSGSSFTNSLHGDLSCTPTSIHSGPIVPPFHKFLGVSHQENGLRPFFPPVNMKLLATAK